MCFLPNIGWPNPAWSRHCSASLRNARGGEGIALGQARPRLGQGRNLVLAGKRPNVDSRHDIPRRSSRARARMHRQFPSLSRGPGHSRKLARVARAQVSKVNCGGARGPFARGRPRENPPPRSLRNDSTVCTNSKVVYPLHGMPAGAGLQETQSNLNSGLTCGGPTARCLPRAPNKSMEPTPPAGSLPLARY